MPAFGTSIPHNLGQQQATEKLQHFLEQVRERYADQLSEMRGDWTEERLEFAFKTMGMAVEGTLIVEEVAVHVNGKLPLAAALFRGRIEQTIRAELEKLLT